MKFNHLNVPSHWQNYWSRYPEGHTILEALISWVSQVDSMVDNQNKLNDNVEQIRNEIDAFVERFDDLLQAEVTQILNDWQTSGFLDVVISEAIQWQLTDYIATNEADKTLLSTQLDQHDDIITSTVDKTNYYVTPNDFETMQEAIDYAITNKVKLKIPNGTYSFNTGLIIDGPIDIEGSFRNTVFDFSGLSTGTAIKIGDQNGIDGVTLNGLRLIGNHNITGIALNAQKNIIKPIVNSNFKNLHFYNFGVGLDTAYIWCNLFENIRTQSCKTPAIFGNQTNNCQFNRCSFVSFTNTISFNNCEGLMFSTCEVANLTGELYALSLYQSNISFVQPYFENILNLANVGANIEVFPSILQIDGGIVTGHIRYGKNRTGLEIKKPRVTVGLTIDCVGPEFYLYQPEIKLGGFESPKKKIVSYNGKTAFPFSPAWGGQTVTHVLNPDGYAEVTSSQGILIANNLEIGKQYVLSFRLRSDASFGLTHESSVPISVSKMGENIFETRYIPFIATTTALRLMFAGLAHIEHLSLVEGLYFVES